MFEYEGSHFVQKIPVYPSEQLVLWEQHRVIYLGCHMPYVIVNLASTFHPLPIRRRFCKPKAFSVFRIILHNGYIRT